MIKCFSFLQIVLLIALAGATGTALAQSEDIFVVAANTKTITQFTNVIDDLPLMPGLTPQGDKDVLFASGSGRIAQTTALGSVAIEDVYKFYGQTLPQLGWERIDARSFQRDNERLRIDVTGNKESSTVVRFSLEPLRAN